MATAAPPLPPTGDAPKEINAPTAKVVPAAPPKSRVAPAISPDPTVEGPLAGDAEQPPEEVHRPPAGFFNLPWVQNILPLATSLGLHIGIILVGILGYQVAKEITNPNKDQVIIPESKSIEKNAIPGGIPHPGLNNDATRDAAQDAIKNSAEDGFTANVSSNIAAAAGGGQGETDANAFEAQALLQAKVPVAQGVRGMLLVQAPVVELPPGVFQAAVVGCYPRATLWAPVVMPPR